MIIGNRKCLNCGKEYYCCKSCISVNSWKNSCCSKSCYQELLQKLNGDIKPQEIEIKDEGITVEGILENNEKVVIVGQDLDLGRFDCEDNQTRVLDNFKEFAIKADDTEVIVDKENMTEDIYKQLPNKNKSKNKQSKNKQKTN